MRQDLTVAKDFNQTHRIRSAQLLTLSLSRKNSWNKTKINGTHRSLIKRRWIFNSLGCVCHCDLLWFIVIYCDLCDLCDLCDWLLWLIVVIDCCGWLWLLWLICGLWLSVLKLHHVRSKARMFKTRIANPRTIFRNIRKIIINVRAILVFEHPGNSGFAWML